jgi:trehalose-phosphatase
VCARWHGVRPRSGIEATGLFMIDWQELASIPHLVIALDLDGTLVPFAPTPHDAKIDGDTAALVTALSNTPGVTLGLVSGRPRDMMDDLPARFPNVALAAEHGVWRCGNGVWEAALPPVPQLDEIERSLRSLAQRYQGTIVERKSCSVCLHWRLVASTEHAAIATAAEVLVDEWLETNGELERLPVVEAIEIRHRAAHKGVALAWLRGRGPADATMLAIGDDTTDEDMFVSLRDGDLGILVAIEPRLTAARFRLPDVAAVHRFLRWLVESRERRHVTDPEITLAQPAGPHAATKLVVASNRLPNLGGGRGKEVGGMVSGSAGVGSSATRDCACGSSTAIQSRALNSIIRRPGASGSTRGFATRACGRCCMASSVACVTSTTNGIAIRK